MDVLKDLWLFVIERKKYWLVPLILIILLISLLIVFAGNSVLAPFIYSLF